MKRDMDLCRRILFEVEKLPTTLAPTKLEIEGYTDDEVGYNAWLLAGEGLIEGADCSGMGDAVHQYMPRCLTYRGHDFLELARNEDRWAKAKKILISRGGAITFDVLQWALTKMLKGELYV